MIGSLVFGERWLDVLWLHLGAVLVVIAGFAVIVVAALTAPHRVDADRRWFAAIAVVLSGVMFVVPVWVRGTVEMRLGDGVFTGAGSRYVYVPALLLLSGLVVLIDGSKRRWLVGLVAAQGAALIVLCFGLANLRSSGPTWSSQLAIAREACRTAEAPQSVRIPITPDGAGWFVTVPCDRLHFEH